MNYTEYALFWRANRAEALESFSILSGTQRRRRRVHLIATLYGVFVVACGGATSEDNTSAGRENPTINDGSQPQLPSTGQVCWQIGSEPETCYSARGRRRVSGGSVLVDLAVTSADFKFAFELPEGVRTPYTLQWAAVEFPRQHLVNIRSCRSVDHPTIVTVEETTCNCLASTGFNSSSTSLGSFASKNTTHGGIVYEASPDRLAAVLTATFTSYSVVGYEYASSGRPRVCVPQEYENEERICYYGDGGGTCPAQEFTIRVNTTF